MKYVGFVAIVLTIFVSGCGGDRVHADLTPTLQQQVAVGGVIAVPAGTIDIDCSGQIVISKTTTLIGQGRGLTIINDSCPTGDTFLVDVTKPATVVIENMTIVHSTASGTVVRFVGGTLGFEEILGRVLRLSSVDLKSASNCLVSDGQNLLFVEKSYVLQCGNDGAQIGSFGVTLHDNWFGQNGRNGVTFVGAGFCASCNGNEYWLNHGHGLVYAVTGISDARHVGEYVDSNGDIGMVVNGVRDFTFNDGWIGSNANGGAVIGDTSIGTVLVGNTFTNNVGPSLIVTETTGPLRVTGNVSSLRRGPPCDAKINGSCVDLNLL